MNNRVYTYRIYTEKGVAFGEGYLSKEDAEKALSSHFFRMKRIRNVAAGIIGIMDRRIRRKQMDQVLESKRSKE